MAKEPIFRVAINGFGRIGRALTRVLLRDGLVAPNSARVQLVAINTHGTTPEIRAGLVLDSNYGPFAADVKVRGTSLVVRSGKLSQTIATFDRSEPKDLPWRRLKIDLVVESTGRFTDPVKARAHLRAGAKQVLISAWPARGGAAVVIAGARRLSNARAPIITHASCTTSAVAPLIEILRRRLNVEDWSLFGVQAVTHSQSTVDRTRGDGRKRRAAFNNIIPIHLDAEEALPKLFPAMRQHFIGQGVRVPTAIVHFGLLSMVTKRPVAAARLNKILQDAARGKWQGLISVSHEPLVSQDVRQNQSVAVVDLGLTQSRGRIAQVGFWYDNEWAFAVRLRDLIAELAHARLPAA